MGISFLYNRQAVERLAAEINHELGQKAVISFRAGYTNDEREDVLASVNFGKCKWMISAAARRISRGIVGHTGVAERLNKRGKRRIFTSLISLVIKRGVSLETITLTVIVFVSSRQRA